jgi:CRISPR system Cascade subunit CasA
MGAPVLNLTRDHWVPVIRRSGQRSRIRACDLTLDFERDPIIDIDWPRPDFRAAQLEFLIGLLVTACQPKGDSAWRTWWDKPPTTEELAERFAPFETAFDFDGPGPRFLQERADLDSEASPIAGLLIEQPGANTEKNNTDLFVKRGRVGTLGRSTAAIALYALQAFAPKGGAGHRTGARGGGPLTTLAVPPASSSARSLWHLLWLNVTRVFDEIEDELPQERLADVFPWLAPTRLSDKGGVATALADIHPAQCFWGMPRRVALIFETNTARIPCDITGSVEDVILREYRTRPHGVNYQGVPHPLTPTRRVNMDSEWRPVHPQPGGIAYRHWLSFVQPDDPQTPLSRPASCIATAEGRLAVVARDSHNPSRLRLLGFDMDDMKARGFVEAEMPLLFASDARDDAEPGPRQRAFEMLLRYLVGGSGEAVGLLVGAVKSAMRISSGEGLDLVRETFFKDTQAAFFELAETGLRRIDAAPEDSVRLPELTGRWLEATLFPAIMRAFDREVPVDALTDAADLDALSRVVAARRNLARALRGHGRAGKRLFTAMGMSPPAPKEKAPAPKKRKGGPA